MARESRKFRKAPRTGFLISLAATIVLVAFFQFGRPLWGPVALRLAGEDTVSDVMASLRPKMRQRFPNLDILTDGRPIALLAFKDERVLELWKKSESGWGQVRDYPFTGFSGQLGPKLEEGDHQIPEGVYGIEYLNPNSMFHLSLKVGYPNDFDRVKARNDGRSLLGDDIFIHGSNATIGCIPLGDENIEEIFYLVARNGVRNTQVIISPYDMRGETRELEIPAVSWEDELYESIARRLEPFRLGLIRPESASTFSDLDETPINPPRFRRD